jgi:chromosome segregation ATPase
MVTAAPPVQATFSSEVTISTHEIVGLTDLFRRIQDVAEAHPRLRPMVRQIEGRVTHIETMTVDDVRALRMDIISLAIAVVDFAHADLNGSGFDAQDAQLREQIRTLQTERNRMLAELENSRRTIANLKSALHDARNGYGNNRDRVEQLSRDLTNSQSRNRDLKALVSQLRQQNASFERRIIELEARIQHHSSQAQSASSLIQQNEHLAERVKQMRLSIQQKNGEINSLRAEIQRLRDQVSRLNSQPDQGRTVESLRRQLVEAKKQIGAGLKCCR